MAQLPNANALTVSDGLNTYLNIDTVNKIVQILNGAALRMYSDSGATLTYQLTGSTLAPAASASAPDPGNNGTINTANGIARVSPAAARTGCILQAGTTSGQIIWVINEAASANSVTFAASGSNVADGTSDVIAGLTARCFVWDSSVNLWFKVV